MNLHKGGKKMSHGTNKGTIRQQRRCEVVGLTSLPPPLSPPSFEARQGCRTGLIQAIGCWRLRTPKRNSSGTWSGSHSPGMCHRWLWPSGCYCNKDMTVIEEKPRTGSDQNPPQQSLPLWMFNPNIHSHEWCHVPCMLFVCVEVR